MARTPRNTSTPRRAVGVFSGFLGLQQPTNNFVPTNTLGEPAYSIYSGYLNREEKDADLATTRERYRIFAEFLANTHIVAAGVRYFLDLVAKAEWTAEPSDKDNPSSVEAAEFMMDAIAESDTPFRRVVRRASMYKFYGFTMQEWTLKKREEDGRYVFKDIEPRGHFTIERWDTDRTGKVLGIVQRSPQDSFEIYIPRTKCVYVVDDSLTDSPEGLGIFRHVVSEVNRLERYQQLEGFGYETDLRGVPIGRAPITDLQEKVNSGALKKADAEGILNTMKQFMKNHIKGTSNGFIMDSGVFRETGEDGTPSASPMYGLDLLDAGAMGHEAIGAAIERSIRMIAIMLGVEELLLGSDSNGSFALSKNKTRKLFLIVQSTLKELEDSFNKDMVDMIWERNGMDPKLKPKMKAENVQFKDVEEISAALRDMATSGVPITRDDTLVDEFFQLLGLTSPDAEIVQGPMFNEQDAMLPPARQEGKPSAAQDAADMNRDTTDIETGDLGGDP